MDSYPAELALDNQLCFALYDASRAFTRAYAPVLDGLGLTYPQYLVMLVLWEADATVPMGALGDRLHLESSTLTPLLKRLGEQGLIERMRDPADERRVLISLTGAGRDLRAAASDVPAAIFEASGTDQATGLMLRDNLVRIARALERAEVQA